MSVAGLDGSRRSRLQSPYGQFGVDERRCPRTRRSPSSGSAASTTSILLDGRRDRGGVGQLAGRRRRGTCRRSRGTGRSTSLSGRTVTAVNASGTVTPVEAAVAGAVAGAVVPDGGAAVPDAGALGVPDPGEQAATTSPAAIRTAAALSLRGPTVWSRLMALTSSRRRGRAYSVAAPAAEINIPRSCSPDAPGSRSAAFLVGRPAHTGGNAQRGAGTGPVRGSSARGEVDDPGEQVGEGVIGHLDSLDGCGLARAGRCVAPRGEKSAEQRSHVPVVDIATRHRC